MKSTVDLLSKNEKAALAALYETDGYKVLKRVHELELIGMGKDAIVAQTMEQVKFLNGRAFQSKATIDLIRGIYKLVHDEENKQAKR